VICGAATSAANGSSSERILNISSICLSAQTATVAPALARKSSRPSTVNRLSALAHRRAAQSEFGGKLRLLEPMSRRQPPIENAPPQFAMRPLGGRLRGGVGMRFGNVVPQAVGLS